MQAVFDVGNRATPLSRGGQATPALNPGFRYLRVRVDKRTAYFALGYIDPHPDGSTEVWYSGEREVLRLRHGRVVGAVGMATEWLGVRLNAAPALSADLAPTVYSRERDVGPGYRYGIREQIQSRRIQAPARTALLGQAADSLVWVEESIKWGSDLPPSRYALRQDAGKWQVVYSETCLAPDLCFSWQRWQP